MGTVMLHPRQPASTGRAFSLIPVGLKEAALDSPTFRATVVHFAEQLDLVERWLDNFAKNTSRLAHETSALENVLSPFLSSIYPPGQISEAAFDHDYPLAAFRIYGEAARNFWTHTISSMKRLETGILEPIRVFLSNDLRNLKETRRNLDQAQRYFDGLVLRFSSQSKNKEPSALREDAFQLHEARKAYLRAAMDFCTCAPQVKNSLDKMLVRIASDQWKDLKLLDTGGVMAGKMGAEMERIQSWSREIEECELVFKRELFIARKQVEETAEYAARPSRELDDYAVKAFPSAGVAASSTTAPPDSESSAHEKSEKQGWLFQKTVTGKPARSIWLRRWFFVKSGVFGCLIQGSRPGGVEESEKISVLLCSVRPGAQEDRRFCFEIKTKDSTISLQAESQRDLAEWTSAFDIAKREALEDPANTDWLSDAAVNVGETTGSLNAQLLSDPANPQSEEATVHAEGDAAPGLDRAATLAVPDAERSLSLAARGSFDVVTHRRTGTLEKEGDGSRDHAARIIQKLDLHRKSTAAPQLAGSPNPSMTPSIGIPSLVSPSGFILPAGQNELQLALTSDLRSGSNGGMPTSTLAPSTLANPPAPTSLSKAAVIVSGERGAGLGSASGGITYGLMANLWGSKNWGYVNRLDGGVGRFPREGSTPAPASGASGSPSSTKENPTIHVSQDESRPTQPELASQAHHQRSASADAGVSRIHKHTMAQAEFPRSYPVALKAQDAQFHILFPSVPRSQKLVLVFQATLNPSAQQEFPGRVYVTASEIYFYSHHLGLVLISAVSIAAIAEVTAAPGRECDFLFLHLNQAPEQESRPRIIIKTFLEPLRLLQRRLNYLVQHAAAGKVPDLDEILKAFIHMEADDPAHSPSVLSWEDVPLSTPIDGQPLGRSNDVKANLRIDSSLHGDSAGSRTRKAAAKFKLPSQPVIYAPRDMIKLSLEEVYHLSAKALFHVLFGDKSAIFQILYRDRELKNVVQGPWLQKDRGKLQRLFDYTMIYRDIFARSHQVTAQIQQVVEVRNDHLCYMVGESATPCNLPFADHLTTVTKYVITHVSKSHCKLAIFSSLDWREQAPILKGLIERAALHDLDLNAFDINEVLKSEVAKLGDGNGTRRAVQIFGSVGQQSQASQISTVHAFESVKQRGRPMKRWTLPLLIIGALRSYAARAFLAVLAGIYSAVNTIFTLLTAHSILVIILVTSAAFNFVYFSTTASGWLAERNALRIVSTFSGYHNTLMSKTVYLRDIEELWVNETAFSVEPTNMCLATFRDLLDNAKVDTGYSTRAQPLSTAASTKSVARRLQQSRQNIASYRHNLMVAMRLVNRIDHEILDAEWQNWLFSENMQCRRLRKMLAETRTNQSDESVGPERDYERIEKWYGEYCGSCRRAQDALDAGEAITMV